MTAHDFRVARAARAIVEQPRRAKHPLAQMNPQKFARRFVVFTPTGSQIDVLVEQGRKDFVDLANADVVRRVVSHNPDCLWAIARRKGFDVTNPLIKGFVAFLMLNEAGLEQLIKGTLDGTNPDLALLTGQNEKPSAIYLWAIHARGVLAGGITLAFEKIWTPLYRGADIYGRAVTTAGHRLNETMGMERGATHRGIAAPHLHVYRRSPVTSEEQPLYDGYSGHGAEHELSVTVARSIEDLMRVMAVRSAVYIAEQECPYLEEFDGNDFSSTHLLGYVANEPAGCIRVRFFADFAKIERLAVRREFRKNKLAHQLVMAAMELCRAKGYRRMYGHAQRRLVKFWSQFGFEVFAGAKEFTFSDFDYVEMAFDAARHPQAITIGVNPYIIIRPEGQWHKPGILERSASRPVTRPSVSTDKGLKDRFPAVQFAE